MRNIKYIGTKPTENAFYDRTGIVWTPGKVDTVLDDAVAVEMLKHPEVFEDVGPAMVPERADSMTPQEKAEFRSGYGIDGAGGEVTEISSDNVTFAQPDVGATARNIAIQVREMPLSPEQFWQTSDGSDFTNAFMRLNTALAARGKGHVVFKETYQVFRQSANPAPAANMPYWRNASGIALLNLTDLQGKVLLEFVGGEMRARDGLRYGSFDPLTGDPYTHGGGSFTNTAYKGEIGDYIRVNNCPNVEINGLKIYGNSEAFINGGYWGDLGRQLVNSGVYVYNSKVLVQDFDIVRCGLDNIYVTGDGGFDLGTRLVRGRLHQGGRQGLSWTGGDNLYAKDVTCSQTGKGPVISAPAAGFDIEHNGQGTNNGLFEDCHFIDCAGPAVLAPIVSNTKQIEFKGGSMVGLTEKALWAASPGMSFRGVKLQGICTNIHATTLFDGCEFTNEPYKGTPLSSPLMLDLNSAAAIKNSTIRATRRDGYNFNIRGGYTLENTEVLFQQVDPLPRDNLGIFGPGTHVDVRIKEQFTFVSQTRAAMEVASESAFVDYDSAINAIGRGFISGSALAIGGRSGRKNYKLASIKQEQYTDEFSVVLAATGTVFDIPVGEGNHFVTLYKIDGNTLLRMVAATWLVSSTASSTPGRHVFNKLVDRSADMGAGGSVAMVQVGSNDVIRLTAGTVPLNNERFYVRKTALSAISIPA